MPRVGSYTCTYACTYTCTCPLHHVHTDCSCTLSCLQECSGVADPGPLAQLFWLDDELESNIALDGIIAMVDAVHLEQNVKEQRGEAVSAMSYDMQHMYVRMRSAANAGWTVCCARQLTLITCCIMHIETSHPSNRIR